MPHAGRMTDRRWWLLIAAILAAGAGVAIGRFIHFVATIPNLMALWSGLLAVTLGGAIVLAILMGLGMSAFRHPKAGLQVIGLALALGLGGFVGARTGEGYRVGVEMPARVDVTIDAPISQSFSGAGTCRTIDNGDRVISVIGNGVIRVGNDRMSIFIYLRGSDLGGHRVGLVGYLTAGRLASYNTTRASEVGVDADGNRTTGAGTFTGLEAGPQGQPIEGLGAETTLDGSFAWTCTQPEE
jgi:hypothetical protein